MVADFIKEALEKALKGLGLDWDDAIVIEHPNDLKNGDYSVNVALVLSKVVGKSPRELADEILNKLNESKNEYIEKVEVAGPGFINFYLSQKFFVESLEKIIKEKEDFGRNDLWKGKKVLVEYTDPNLFKTFHTGHLMSNSIGEAITRIFEFSGADLKRANYQGDVGLHVAKVIWAWQKNGGGVDEDKSVTEKSNFLAEMYVEGNKVEETNKDELDVINKKIYERSDEEVNRLYDIGKKWSLEYFENIYKKLDTKFDRYYLESEVSEEGKKIVKDNLGKVFRESDGAIIFPGEEFGLHTRVFVNKIGLPTYEAKELALGFLKEKEFSPDKSVVITGNDITEYFKVLMKAMEQIDEKIANKTKHISHGMFRTPEGKMSSRLGNVIATEDLIEKTKEAVLEKAPDTDNNLAEKIAIGAIKYSILRQEAGQNIIFDFDKSISFTGDSGPYLQYTYARIQSVLNKAKEEGIEMSLDNPEVAGELERSIYHFPEVVYTICQEYALHKLVAYLTWIASSFNSYYGNTKILGDKNSSYRLALAFAVGQVLKNGLHILGIEAPEKM